jgi:hypothetical protein
MLRSFSDDSAADVVLVVQIRLVRAISRAVSAPAEGSAELGEGMIRKSVQRFTEKIMPNQEAKSR